MDNPETDDAWRYTLELLLLMQLPKPSCDSGGEARGLCKRAEFIAFGNQRARVGCKRVVYLHIIEKYSNSTIVVCWRDATAGCYSEQLWKAVTARAGSTCALSGLPIRRGDPVFRPWARGYKPVNRDSMILASAVEQAIGNETCDLLAG